MTPLAFYLGLIYRFQTVEKKFPFHFNTTEFVCNGIAERTTQHPDA